MGGSRIPVERSHVIVFQGSETQKEAVAITGNMAVIR